MTLRRTVLVKALQSSTHAPTLTSTTTATTSSSDTPFFQSTFSPTPQSSEAAHKQELSNSILEWIFFTVALALVGTIVACRSLQLRRKNRPIRQFFSFSNATRPHPHPRQPVPRTTGLPSTGSLHPIPLTHEMLYPTLAPLPSAYIRPQRRTRGADIGAGGRRAGEGGGDWDPDHKEPLPAYDNVGGPPRYAEMEVDSARTRLHLDLAGAHYTERGRSSEGDDSSLSMHSPQSHSRETDIREQHLPEELNPTSDPRLNSENPV